MREATKRLMKTIKELQASEAEYCVNTISIAWLKSTQAQCCKIENENRRVKVSRRVNAAAI